MSYKLDPYRNDPELKKIDWGDESKMQISLEELEAAEIPMAHRDYCAHLILPLKKCRMENMYLPWRCKYERHVYEKCQFDLFQKRIQKIENWRQEKMATSDE